MYPTGDKYNLIYAGEKIYYTAENIILPELIKIGNLDYFRFCDFILIPKTTEELNPTQVKIVNNIRAKYLKQRSEFQINLKVKEQFLKVINEIMPKKILEVGPDSNPLIVNDKNIELFYADLNEESVRELNTRQLKCFQFGADDILKLEDKSIDLIVAVFVLQFELFQSQISELYRVLTPNGVFVANIYRRNEHSKEMLVKQFKKSGFKCKIVQDPDRLCHNHEFCFVYKEISIEKLNNIISIISIKQ